MFERLCVEMENGALAEWSGGIIGSCPRVFGLYGPL